MSQKSFLIPALLCVTALQLPADFSYEQSSKITGGVMAGMMRVAGAFSRQAREPIRSTILIKGDRMASITGARAQVVDLQRETMTEIDFEKKTYSTITFEQLRQALDKISQQMQQQKGQQKADMSFKASVKETGQTRNIAGLNAKEAILTLEMEAKDKKSGDSGAFTVVSDMWLSSGIAGAQEVKSFHERMARKLAWNPGAGMMGAMMQQRADMSKGFAELSKEAAKLEGFPVMQVIRMGTAGQGGTDAAQGQSQRQQQPSEPPPTAGDVAGGAAAGAASQKLGKAGAIGGVLGGFGGFGRRKKQQQEPPSQPPPQASQPAAQQAPGPAMATLIEFTTEVSSFSSAPVDASKFEVPAGFKQVESNLEKQLKK
ncbi:MAG: hypothetical protein HYZ57_06725 [Acidobacteria bacterium]|nr:hypothetical protein [Acidobacteriota bacterium]MBI3279519.1 hypothetical protein [Acidobacteriota bacterium]